MIMETNLASQFPDALNQIELMAMGMWKIQSQFSPVVPQPGGQRPSMMISRIISCCKTTFTISESSKIRFSTAPFFLGYHGNTGSIMRN